MTKAQCGDTSAQFDIGNRYRHGVRGMSEDRVEAARWLGLATGQGHEHAATSLARLQEYLTPEQIAEAERLITEWEPENCSDIESAISDFPILMSVVGEKADQILVG